VVNQQDVEVVAVENDDIRHQVAGRGGRLRSSKHIIGTFEPCSVSALCSDSNASNGVIPATSPCTAATESRMALVCPILAGQFDATFRPPQFESDTYRSRGRELLSGIRCRSIAAGLSGVMAGLTLCCVASGTAGASSKKPQTLRILVTNDDGVGAPGINATVKALTALQLGRVDHPKAPALPGRAGVRSPTSMTCSPLTDRGRDFPERLDGSRRDMQLDRQ
jgi:hypothetical protein